MEYDVGKLDAADSIPTILEVITGTLLGKPVRNPTRVSWTSGEGPLRTRHSIDVKTGYHLGQEGVAEPTALAFANRTWWVSYKAPLLFGLHRRLARVFPSLQTPDIKRVNTAIDRLPVWRGPFGKVR